MKSGNTEYKQTWLIKVLPRNTKRADKTKHPYIKKYSFNPDM